MLLEAGEPIPATLPVGPASTTTPAARAGRRASCRSTRACAGWSTSPRPSRSAWASASRSRRSSRPGRSTRCSCSASTRRWRPRPAAPRLEALLDAQHYTRGLAFVAPGHADEQHGRGRHRLQPPRPRRRARASRASPAAAQGRLRRRRSPRACSGIRPRPARRPRRRRAARRTLDARHLQTALWPVTGGYYLEQIMGSPEGQPATFTDAQLDAARRYFIDFVRALGPAADAARRPPAVRRAAGDVARPARGRPGRHDRFVAACASCAASGDRRCRGVPRLAAGRRARRARRDAAHAAGVGRATRARLAFDSEFFAPTAVFASQLEPAPAGPRRAAPQRGCSRAIERRPRRRSERFFDLIPARRLAPARAPLVTRGGEQPGPAARRELHRVPAHGELRRPAHRALAGRLPAEGRSWTRCSTSCCATRCCSPTATSRAGSSSAAARSPARPTASRRSSTSSAATAPDARRRR